jgi:hypothetical protein
MLLPELEERVKAFVDRFFPLWGDAVSNPQSAITSWMEAYGKKYPE